MMRRSKQSQDQPALPGTPLRVQTGPVPVEREDANNKGKKKQVFRMSRNDCRRPRRSDLL